MFTIPRLAGIFERRILLNYAVDPARLDGVLPDGVEPRLVRGRAIVGACLIRLTRLRPAALPAAVGLRSENAAVRIAVRWQRGGREETGVWITHRVTNSRLVRLGDRFFPTRHELASFAVEESDDRVSVAVGDAIRVAGRPSDEWPEGSVFETHEEASDFFEDSPVGFSACDCGAAGIELSVPHWRTRPLAVERETLRCRAGGFDLPAANFDHALLMRDIEHEWRSVRGR